MSISELPPIQEMGRPRTGSHSTNRSSLKQVTPTGAHRSSQHNTCANPLPSNHSDSSFKELMLFSRRLTRSSASINSYPSVNGLGGGGGGGESGRADTPGSGDRLLPPGLPPRSSSRALSWCATDVGLGWTPRLQSPLDRHNGLLINNNKSGSANSLGLPGTPPPLKAGSQDSVTDLRPDLPPRCVSVGAVRKDDSPEVATIKARYRGPVKEPPSTVGGKHRQDSLTTIQQLAHLKVNNGTRRSTSGFASNNSNNNNNNTNNKLVEKKNVRNSRRYGSQPILSTARNASSTERLASPRKPSRPVVSALTLNRDIKRVSSSALPNARTRLYSARNSISVGVRGRRFREGGGGGVGGGESDNSEEDEERRQRIREWLIGVDCADVPPEPDIEYEEDPPQTDTAVHIVYTEES